MGARPCLRYGGRAASAYEYFDSESAHRGKIVLRMLIGWVPRVTALGGARGGLYVQYAELSADIYVTKRFRVT